MTAMSTYEDTLERQIIKWRDSGTWGRLQRTSDERAPIQIRRSSGEMVTGVIVEVNVRCIVAWGDGADQWEYVDGKYRFVDGVQHKLPLTQDVLAWNPWLDGEGGQ